MNRAPGRPCTSAGRNSRRRAGALQAVVRAFVLVCSLACCLVAQSQPPAPAPNPPSSSTNLIEAIPQRVYRLYREARARWQRETNNAEAAWQFARACFDWADFARDKAQLAAIAEEGIVASRRAIEFSPKSAAAHYYLGLNLGQLAQTKLLGALKLISEIETVWLKAVELDPRFDFAGPHRSLAILYRDAPGWSIGNKTKARAHARKAVELFPEYPGNHLVWLESLLTWGEVKTVRQQVPVVEKILNVAREKFTGDAWARDWQEWERQWRSIRSRAGVSVLEGPIR